MQTFVSCLRIVLTTLLLVPCVSSIVDAAPQKAKPPNPDFTQGNTPLPRTHDWTLGATGARGWMYAWKLETTESRQIYVTKIEKGSPSDGILRVGDVILGVDGQAFRQDARVSFARAVSAAEAGDGVLRLMHWRDGKQTEVRIAIPAIGAYGPTAPYDCEKSKHIFEDGCAALANRMRNRSRRGNPIERSLNALALLASGNPDYLPLVKEEAKWASEFSIPPREGFHSWWYGYVSTFLAEYVLATGDQSVMPGLERLTMETVRGQSAVGSWGHKFANPETGILYGYGAMNSPGLSLTISLCLAREAGVSDPALDVAIEKSHRWLGFYVGKGAIPYGDHHPWLKTHDDNGKCGQGAVLFDLLGDADGATFFSRMSTACHGQARDTGHTGNFFNLLWALPGISRSGPEATGAWLKEFGWYFDFARRWDGTFIYQGEPGTSARTAGHKYDGWDSTGAYLLAYALPLRSLRITGRTASVAHQLDADEAVGLIDDGRGWTPIQQASSFKRRSTEELMEMLSSWSPVVRDRAATAISDRANADVVRTIIQLLESDNLDSKRGACAALEAMGKVAAPAVPHLIQQLSHDDHWLRIQAGEALSAIGQPAHSAVPQLLALTASDPPGDTRRMIQRYMAFLLFHPGRIENVRGMLAKSVDGVDRELLYDAVRAVLQNEDGRARGTVSSVYDLLTFEEVAPLLPEVYEAIVEPAPSGVMFASGIRLKGLELLAKHRVKEGIPLCIPLMDIHSWGKKARIAGCLKALEMYGGAAKSQLPALRELEEQLLAHRESRMLAGVIQEVRRVSSEIENAEGTPTLRSLPPAPK